VGAVDEQHRLTRPHDLILEFDAVDLGVFHDDSSVPSGPGWAGRKGGATCAVATRHAV
jgi:hypothetical protein